MLKAVETSDHIKWPSFAISRLQRYLGNIVVIAAITIGFQLKNKKLFTKIDLIAHQTSVPLQWLKEQRASSSQLLQKLMIKHSVLSPTLNPAQF